MSSPKSPKQTPASPKSEPKSPTKRPAVDAGEGAKKARKAPNMAEVRKQIEYYFSDLNLKSDKFFHEKISSNADGWLEMALLQSCNKMKVHAASDADIVKAIESSPLETKTVDGNVWVRRPDGKATLPELSARPMQDKRVMDEKKKLAAHDGGVLLQVTEIPEDIAYAPIKDALREQLPKNAKVIFATSVNDKGQCIVLLGPFDGHVEHCEKLELVVNKETLKLQICYGVLLQECLKQLPKYILKRRETMAKNQQRKRQKPVTLAGQKFANLATVRGKVKEIILARKDGQMLVEGSPDTALVKAILGNHPRADEKLKGMTGIKVDVSQHDAGADGKKSRCFHIVRADGTAEDISCVKCFQEIETQMAQQPAEEEKTPESPKSPKSSPASPKSPTSPTSSPKKAPASPKKEAASPKKEAASPKKEAASPKKVPASPKKA